MHYDLHALLEHCTTTEKSIFWNRIQLLSSSSSSSLVPRVEEYFAEKNPKLQTHYKSPKTPAFMSLSDQLSSEAVDLAQFWENTALPSTWPPQRGTGAFCVVFIVLLVFMYCRFWRCFWAFDWQFVAAKIAFQRWSVAGFGTATKRSCVLLNDTHSTRQRYCLNRIEKSLFSTLHSVRLLFGWHFHDFVCVFECGMDQCGWQL